MKLLNNSKVFVGAKDHIDDLIDKITNDLLQYIEIYNDDSIYLDYEFRIDGYQFIVELKYETNSIVAELYYIDCNIHEFLTYIDFDIEDKTIINRQVVKDYLLDVIDDLPIGGHAYGTT